MSLIKALRIPEVALMSGFFIIGSFFGIDEWNYNILIKLVMICFISFFTILSVYTYNAAAGKQADVFNKRLSALGKFSSLTYKISGIIFLLFSIALSALIHIIFPLLTLIVYLIWLVYAHPKWGLKHKAYWGTVLHFFAQILHFNMCYFAFKDVSIYSISLSVFFAIAFSAGHLNHEIIDYEADKHAQIKTTAVKHGIHKVLFTIIVLCAVNIFYCFVLKRMGIIDNTMSWLMIIPSFLHLSLYIIYAKNILKKSKLIRSFYRTFYLISILLIIIDKYFNILT
ncbi:MAG TPA: UbiA family prenyltransferase [Bacteroidales bacterium]|nr:UbiA family prenyltransferase [Bacteroidales bacterium]